MGKKVFILQEWNVLTFESWVSAPGAEVAGPARIGSAPRADTGGGGCRDAAPAPEAVLITCVPPGTAS